MKRAAICIFLCTVLILLASGCDKKSAAPSPEEAAIRAITDAAVMEKYELEDLKDFRFFTYDSPNGNSYACYLLQLCGYDAHDSIKVTLDRAGTITDISDTLGKYVVFLDHVNRFDIWWAKFRLSWKLIKYYDEEHRYSLFVNNNGDLCLAVELIDHFKHPETDQNGNTLTGCGKDHDHVSFHVILCSPPSE